MKFIIQNKHRPDNDGLHPVAFYVLLPTGKPDYIPANLRSSKREWDNKRGKFKTSADLATVKNEQLEKMEAGIRYDLANGLTVKQIKDKLKGKSSSGNTSLIYFIGQHIAEVKRGLHEVRESTRRHYECTKRILGYYCKWKGVDDLSFSDITLGFYNDFHTFLTTVRTSGNQGFSNHIKRIKKFMTIAKEMGLHDNREYSKRAFKTFKSDPDKIYLDEIEINKLETVDLSESPDLEKERDRWLFSFYTLTRYSDSVNMSKKNLIHRDGNPYLMYEAQKTGKNVMIPLKPAALAIMEKYKWNFGVLHNTKSNQKIKRICTIAGITDVVEEGKRKAPKCEFITTHTARRSAAIGLSLAGVPITEIMDLGGWESITVLRGYLKHAKVDSAKKATNHEFFR